MNNLKRVLSTVLAGTMLAGMMVVGASAANFPDADKIEHTEAVNTLAALNVISGKENGNYDPEGSLTRAEMAKLAVFILHGGKDPILGTKATPSYTDIKGNWAESYIEYCSATGIINGMGDGTFGPSATLTGSQAAKMLLVAMGYNAEVFGFTGADWEINTNIEANKIGLYEGLETMDPSVTITRDEAAQLVYNAMFAGIMTKNYTHDISTGNVTNTYTLNTAKTLFTEKFNGTEKVGFLTDASYNPDTKKYQYTVNCDGVAAGASVTGSVLGAGVDVDVSTTADFTSLVGRKVTVLYKDIAGSVESCFGIYAEDAIVSATVGELTTVTGVADKASLAGTAYKLAQNYTSTVVYEFKNGAMHEIDGNDSDSASDEHLNNITADQASALTLVDTDKNGKYDYAIVAPVTVAKVTYVGANGITAGAPYTFQNDTIEAGLKKGDFVTVTASTNTVYSGNKIDKVETITGTVDGLKNTTDVLVGGKWYSCAQNAGDTVSLNKEFTFAVIGGYYYNADKTTEDASMDNLVMVIDHATAADMGQQSVKFLTASNEKVVKTVTKIGGTAVSSGNKIAAGQIGTLYTYTEKNGNWELTAVSATNALGYTYDGSAGTFTAAGTNTAAKIGSYNIADDAVVFVDNEKTTSPASARSFKTITGATVNDWAGAYGDSSVVLYKTVNGVKYIVAVAIKEGDGTVPSATGEVGNYGYIVSTPYQLEESNTKYYTYDIWTGSETVTVKDEDSTLDVAKGDIISYTDLGGGIIKASTKVAGGATGAVAVTGYGDKVFEAVTYSGAAIDDTIITKDTVIMYVDSKAVKGVEGGEIALAAIQADGSRIMNAWAVQTNSGNSTNEALKLIVIEVNNDIEALANDTVSSSGGAAGFAICDATVTGTTTGVTVATDLDYAIEGDKVTVTLTCGSTATATKAHISTLTNTSSDAVASNGSTNKLTFTAGAGTHTLSVTVGSSAITAITVTLEA